METAVVAMDTGVSAANIAMDGGIIREGHSCTVSCSEPTSVRLSLSHCYPMQEDMDGEGKQSSYLQLI